MNLVLLVNDNVEVRDRTASMLTEMGWEVYVADSEDFVFESIVAFRPTIMIVDVEMDGGIGFESIATARRLFDDMFIIAVTRGGDKKLWPKVATVCGANAYVVGPVSAAKLDRAIQDGLVKGLISGEPSPQKKQRH